MKQDFDPETRRSATDTDRERPRYIGYTTGRSFVAPTARRADYYARTASGMEAATPRAQTTAGAGMETTMPRRFAPAVDLVETPEALTVVVDLPGSEPDDVELQITDRHLRILAEREDDFDEEGWTVKRERPSAFERTVDLPAVVDVEAADASWDEGVCRVFLPKDGGELGRIIRFD